MIQDIAPHILHNEYKHQKPRQDSYLLCYRKGEVLVRKKAEELTFPQFAEFEKYDKNIYDKSVYSFTIDQDTFYLALDLDIEEVPSFTWENIRIFRSAKPQHMGFAEILGHQLHDWYVSHRFCGKCGQPMKHDQKERMLYCERCNVMEYPKISPAVIVGLINGDKILMSKYAGREYTNYALLAGFVEVGETLEETVSREVMEEVGLRVKNIRYYKNQPWPATNSLLVGFYAELDGDDKIVLDENELAMAGWFSRDQIEVKRDNISLTNDMIMSFKEGKY